MLTKSLSTFVVTSKTIIAGTFKLATVQNSVNETGKSEEKLKTALINFLNSNGKNAKHSCLSLH